MKQIRRSYKLLCLTVLFLRTFPSASDCPLNTLAPPLNRFVLGPAFLFMLPDMCHGLLWSCPSPFWSHLCIISVCVCVRTQLSRIKLCLILQFVPWTPMVLYPSPFWSHLCTIYQYMCVFMCACCAASSVTHASLLGRYCFLKLWIATKLP